ncbi:DUF4279 domain-containing protein [Crossiella sp. CA-258035]|uniref:DUF4279 domain-containing protein n=1 Tax=Crossiella sp. CA-258035 TaxID=2981138 RepID=UPI0024BCD5BB|nr:DUF4279 domain-containing protein [Crossiella sp. CA-258035]WHT21448.1 DUF4279 domain-containing protein [Crossiella sp. CA-258035]
MSTWQYSYFALKSTKLSAAQIADRLRMPPDEVMVMGSRDPERVRPRCHSWEIVRRSDESVDEQLEHIVDRLRPVREPLIALVAEGNVVPVMQVVRYFRDDEDRHTPLGWHLDLPVLEFLVATGAELDVDEYDYGWD